MWTTKTVLLRWSIDKQSGVALITFSVLFTIARMEIAGICKLDYTPIVKRILKNVYICMYLHLTAVTLDDFDII